MSLTAAQIFVMCVLIVAGGLIVSSRLRSDLVALLVLVSLALDGVVTPAEAFSGFSSPAILTLAGLFVLTAAMNQAGIVHWIAEQLGKLTGDSETKMVTVFILVGAALSLIVNTAAAGSVLLPAVVGLARRHGVPVSKVLMPMGFGVIVGGTATIFTTANIIMSGLLQTHGHAGLTMFDFFPTGSVLVLVTTIYLVGVGRHLLPKNAHSGRLGTSQSELSSVYELDQRLWELRILPGSPLSGQTLAQARLEFPVLAVWHKHQAEFKPSAETRVEVDDILLVSGGNEQVEKMKAHGVTVGRGRKLGGPEIPVVIVEVVIPPRSQVVGQSLRQLKFQTRFGLTSVALWRSGRSHRTNVGSMSLQAGDALLVVGTLKKILRLTEDPDYLVVDTPAYPPMSKVQSAWTLIVTIGVVFAAGLDLISMSLAAVAGALTLVLAGLLSVERAYAAINWSVLVLVAGMAPLAIAMNNTGWTALFGDLFGMSFGGYGALATVAALYLFTVLITQLVGGQVSALFTGPIALSLAETFHIDLTAMAVFVAIACSNCFLTSVAHPVNVLIAGPGEYRGVDFLKVGVGLQIVCFVAAMSMAHFYWGL